MIAFIVRCIISAFALFLTVYLFTILANFEKKFVFCFSNIFLQNVNKHEEGKNYF